MREYLIARTVRLMLCVVLSGGFLSSTAQTKPTASFTATPVQGCTPVLVRFSDASSGNPTSWKWDLGNGTISFLQNPATTYFNPGTYTITLIATNSAGSDTVVQTNYITIHATPTVNFSSSATTGCFPLDVQFNDISDAGSGNIVSWEWDFGDGTLSSDQNPVHTYTGAGNYNVSLRVTNSNGCVQTLTRPNYITLTNGVRANFTFTAPNNCKPPASVTFTNRSTGTGTLSYAWDFGDGSTSTLTNPTHTYSTPGQYTVKLVVRNNTGCVHEIVRANVINIGTVNADFSTPAVICAGTHFDITNTSAPVPVAAKWTFSDGTTSTDINPKKKFTNPGNYTITLESDFGNCKDIVTKTVQVLAKPTAAFTATNNISCKAPLQVDFNASVAGATGYQWDFGDGGTGTGSTPSHTYQTEGTYDVRLVVTNAAGCTDTLIKKKFVKITPPEVAITNPPVEECIPYTFRPTLSVTSVSPIVSYQWDFGDGGTSTQQFPAHNYTKAGTYTVKLTYTTAGGCTGTAIATNLVKVGEKPVVNFSATPPINCASGPIRFTDQTTGAKPDKWLWDFGDGSFSSLQHPDHLYQDTGYFNVQLIAWSNGCSDTLVIKRIVYILPPVAKFDALMKCDQPLRREFMDRSIAATSWQWDFGDGSTSTNQNPVHQYAAPGRYLVKLTVWNKTCKDDIEKQVVVMDEKADFTASAQEVCKGTVITFNAVNSNPQNVQAYDWNLYRNGTRIAGGAGQTVKFNLNDAGSYEVRLKLTDQLGCVREMRRTDYIKVYGPTARFKPKNPSVCPGATVEFTDESTTDGTHPIQQWTWDFGDGSTQTFTAPPFSHTYTKAGVYNVRLTVRDSRGCTHSRTMNQVVTISLPEVQFSSPDLVSCVGKPIRFTNQSKSNAGTYSWDFGDGNTSTAEQPVHRYTAEGIYTVKLTVRDMYGCENSFTRPQYIKIANPVAGFTVNQTTSSCPPLVAKFTNQSQNFNKITWDFGDGNTSTKADPEHFYTYPGTYKVMMIITSPGGCRDTAYETMVIKGPQGSFTYDNTAGCDPLTVNFIGTTNDPANKFIWDYNDGNIFETTQSRVSHTYKDLGDYLPKMILEDPQGCRVPITGKDTIHVYGVKAQFTANHKVICDSGSVSFKNTSVSNDQITGYRWEFGDGQTSTEKDPVHFFRTPGLHTVTLTVTTQHNCREKVSIDVPVKVMASPIVAIQSADGACVPATFTFKGQVVRNDTSALNWRWNFANGSTAQGQNPQPVTYTTAGDFKVQLITTNSSGCADTIDKIVQAHPLPALDAGPDQTICRGSNTTLQATGAAEFIWSPANHLSCTNCSAPLASPLESIRYFVTGRNGFGCEAKDSIQIKVKQPFTMQAHAGDTLCKGETLQLFASGAELYSWTPATGLDNPSSDRPRAKPDATVEYQVIGRDDHNCFRDTALVRVVVYPYPTVNAGEDQSVGVGNSVTLHPVISSDTTSIKWYPPSWLSCITCPEPVATPRKTTTYTIEAVNQGGCVTKDDITLSVFCNNSNLFVPNTFSPNADGHNDVFYPRGKGVFSIRFFRVFNRWGDLVFEATNVLPNDASKGWNGIHKGQLAPQDVYVYTMEIICENNTIFTEKGNVMLVR